MKGSQPAPVTQSAPVKVEAVARINPKYDWYQNMSHVFISFKVEGSNKELAKQTKVNFDKQLIGLNSGDQSINIQLSNEIDAEGSISNPTEKKLELKLKKVKEGVNWV